MGRYVNDFDLWLNEAEDKQGLSDLTRNLWHINHAIKDGAAYKDDSPKALFDFFTCDGGHPIYGFPNSYLKAPGNLFSQIIKDAKSYLASGKTPTALITMLEKYIHERYAGYNRGEVDKKAFADRATDALQRDFTPENKDNKFFAEEIPRLIEKLSSWNSATKLGRINIAASLLDATTYSSYAGSDFKEAYEMSMRAIKKLKLKVDQNAKIEFDKDAKSTKSEEYRNTGEFVSVTSNSYSNDLVMRIDGHEYPIGSYNTTSAYGRY